jgi:hypothetical protein
VAEDIEPTREALIALGAWAPRFEAPDFRVGDWEGGVADAEGVIQMPFMSWSADVERFVDEVGRNGLVRPFDWMRWAQTPQGHDLLTNADAVAAASAADLVRVLTTIVRAERFGEGEIESAFERGIVQACARRAGELAG